MSLAHRHFGIGSMLLLAMLAGAPAVVCAEKSISPAHRAEMQRSVGAARQKVSAARNTSDWGVAMEELCKQQLQLELFDDALSAAQAVVQRDGVDPERRAAMHFLVAQIYAYKMEAATAPTEIQRNRQMALRTADEIVAKNYSQRWGVTAAAKKLAAGLQAGGGGNSRQSQTQGAGATANYDSRTGQLQPTQGFWNQLNEDEVVTEIPSLSGGRAPDYNADPEAARREFEQARRGTGAGMVANPDTAISPDYPTDFTGRTASSSPYSQQQGTAASRSTPAPQTGNMRSTLGGYSPYPNVPGLAEQYDSRTRVDKPSAGQTPQRKPTTAAPATYNPTQMTTEELMRVKAGRSPDAPRYGELPGEITRAQQPDTRQQAFDSRTKRPDVYKSRNTIDDDVIAPQRPRPTGGIRIDGEQIVNSD